PGYVAILPRDSKTSQRIRVAFHRLRLRSRTAPGEMPMAAKPGALFAILFVAAVIFAAVVSGAALAQKRGGTLRIYHRDSPATMSVHEEGTISAIMPMMPVFNNLVVYDPHIAQMSLQSILPDLAESWNWGED